ncbi:MAG: RAMP superfamily CRISPR-associated protein [Deltaproteobacteria bacterium]|nr:RAMP superfamily CRISPR-associated protein [Deltaproteobacteria bacterium]
MTLPKRSSLPFYCEVVIPVAFDTPYHIGSGEAGAFLTDAPILRLTNGKPFIPGASVRGALRGHIEREFNLLGCTKEDCEWLFGPDRTNRKDHFRGRLRVCDLYPPEMPKNEIRDHVAIEPRWGAAATGAKFDMEVALPKNDQGYVLRLIYEGDDVADREYLLFREAVEFIQRGRLRMGAKSGWGLGRLAPVSDKIMPVNVFRRNTPSGLAAYLNQRLNPTAAVSALTGPPLPLAPSTAATATPVSSPIAPRKCAAATLKPWAYLDLSLRLQFEGPVIVKAPIPPKPRSVDEGTIAKDAMDLTKYSERGASEADMVFITTRQNNGEKYFPGSSLRGVLRAQAGRIVAISPLLKNSPAADCLFGVIKKQGGAGRKTLLEIGDGTLVSADKPVYFDHVAIDRITHAAEDGAKFSTSALVSPRFNHRITLRFTEEVLSALRLFAFLLRDLMEGQLWAGAGIGRGYGYIKTAVIESCTIEIPDRLSFSMTVPGWNMRQLHTGRNAWDWPKKKGKTFKFEDLKDLWTIEDPPNPDEKGGAK